MTKRRRQKANTYMLDLLKGCIGVELCELERCGIQTTVNEFMLHVCEYNECIINMDMADSLEHLDPSEILRSFQDYTGFVLQALLNYCGVLKVRSMINIRKKVSALSLVYALENIKE